MNNADHVYRTVTQLQCGHAIDSAVADAALLLERASGKKTGLEEFDALKVTAKQAEQVKQALLFALGCHPPMGVRGSIVYALSRTADENLKKLYARELLAMKLAMQETSAAMLQALLALEGLGEEIYPEGTISKSVHEVEMNWRCADRFLKNEEVISEKKRAPGMK